MSQHRGEQPVSRVTGADVGHGMDAPFQSALEAAEAASEVRKLRYEAFKPLWGLLQEDEAASAAARKLFERVSKDIEARREHRSIMSSGTTWSFDIPPGTTFFTPPYDYARPGPTHGHDVNVAADPIAGALSVDALPTGDWDGAVAGASAIGLGLEFRNTGLVSVRPLLKYDCDWFVDTFALSASSVGHIGFQVNAEGGPIVSTIQDFTAWNVTDDNYGEDGGYVRSPYQEVKFSAEAHRRYELWIWATVSGDQSGNAYVWGSSQMWGRIWLSVPFVAVQTL